MLELFEFPPTRSQRAKWALEELGVDYSRHIIDLGKGDQNTDTFHALHPLGAVPVLRTEDYVIFESVAIVLQLIDEHSEKNLAPPLGTAARAAYYQWSVFAGTELDPAIMMVFDNTMRPLEAMRPPGTTHDARLAEQGRYDFARRAKILNDVLASRDYLLGSTFSGADILVGHSCFMAKLVGLMTGDFPILDAYHTKLSERTAYQRAYEGFLHG
jgi:glutathione S-transferase